MIELDQKTIEACGAVRNRDEVISLVTAERNRCVVILHRARAGDIDGDFRALISRVLHPETDEK